MLDKQIMNAPLCKGIKFPLQKGIKFIELLREQDERMPPLAALCFLYVALHEELYQTDLANLLGVTEASISRNLSLLSDAARSKQSGLGLVELFGNPIEEKQKAVRLTEKGKALRINLLEVLI